MPRTSSATIFLALALPACAGGPRSDPDLESMSTDDLVAETSCAAARSPDYLRYDANYRPRILALLQKRLAWSSEEHAKILAGKIWVGATEVHVRCSWGSPRHASSHVTAAGTAKYWTYGDLLSRHTTVSFVNGKCTGWSTSS
jgi:hypothetical protein